jgi:phosphopantetheinyl transferase
MYIYLRTRDKEMTGESMLRECLSHYAKENSIILSDEQFRSTPIEKEAHGKPFFAEIPGIFFSVSHSGDVWGCAFSSSPVGFDLENIDERLQRTRSGQKEKRFQAIARRWFTPEEYAYTIENGSASFYRVWVRKEAFVKYLGTGIVSGLGNFSTVCGGVLCERIGDCNCIGIELEETEFKDLRAAVCFAGSADIDYRLCLYDQKYGCVRKNI